MGNTAAVLSQHSLLGEVRRLPIMRFAEGLAFNSSFLHVAHCSIGLRQQHVTRCHFILADTFIREHQQGIVCFHLIRERIHEHSELMINSINSPVVLMQRRMQPSSSSRCVLFHDFFTIIKAKIIRRTCSPPEATCAHLPAIQWTPARRGTFPSSTKIIFNISRTHDYNPAAIQFTRQ